MTNIERFLEFAFLALVVAIILPGCQPLFPKDTKSSFPPPTQSSPRKRITTVDVAIASKENAANTQEYIGTAEANRKTVLRSRVEGRLLELNVELGDGVSNNQVLGRLDDSILAATVEQERGELASLESELAKEQLGVKNAQINLQEAKIQLEQAENDAQRYSGLAKIGAISQQQAESYQTAAKVAQQTVFLAQEEVRIAQQAIITAKGRIAAQQATIAEATQRQAYSQIIAPVEGIVVSKNQERGNLIREGEEILAIGDLNTVIISFSIPAWDLNLVQLGQTVTIQFDAIQGQIFSGKVSKISPVANVSTRKIPVEVIVNNENNQIRSGLLAQVQLPNQNQSQIAVPPSAIVQEAGLNYLFIVETEDRKNRQANVSKRAVKFDNSSPNQDRVLIIEGLNPGEKYVVRSSQPLTDSQVVNLSILSE